MKYSNPVYAASDTLFPLWKQSSPRFNWLNKPLINSLGHQGGLKNQLRKGNNDELMNFKGNLKNSKNVNYGMNRLEEDKIYKSSKPEKMDPTGLSKDNNELQDTKLLEQLQDPGNYKENEFATTKQLEENKLHEYKNIGMLKRKKISIQYVF